PPLLSNPFAFPGTLQSLASPGASVNLTGLATGSGVLSKDMVFVLSQTIAGHTFSTPVVVKSADTADNTGNASLQADIQAAVNAGIARIQRLADEAFAPPGPATPHTAATVSVTVSGGKAAFQTGTANDATSVGLRALAVDIDFNKPSGFEELLD